MRRCWRGEFSPLIFLLGVGIAGNFDVAEYKNDEQEQYDYRAHVVTSGSAGTLGKAEMNRMSVRSVSDATSH